VRALERSGQWQGAIREYQLAGEAAPNAPDIARVYDEWGEQSLARGRYEQAAITFQTVITTYPRSGAAGDRAQQDLFETYTTWLRASPETISYPDAIADFVAYRASPSCAAPCQGAARDGEAQARYQFGAQLAGRSQYTNAITQFEIVQAQFPQSPYAKPSHGAAATAYYMLGQQQLQQACSNALPSYQALAKTYGDTPEGRKARAALSAPQRVTGTVTGFPPGAPHLVYLSRSANPATFSFSDDYQATIDARGIPRRLKARERTVEVAPLVPTATPRSSAPGARRPTPASSAVPGEVPKPELVPPVVAASEPSPATANVVAPEPVEGPSARGEHLAEAIDVPEVDDPRISALVRKIQATDTLLELEPLVNELAEAAELAFRTGEHVLMLNAVTALVAIEFRQLERDSSDDRRRVFVQPLRRLANPPVLRQLAVLRHRLADDATLAARAQAVLYRFGTDGADALMDEYANVATLDGRRTVIAALKGLRRTFDALHDWLRNGDEYDVREAIAVLGALGDERAVRMLGDVQRHADPRVRRAVVSELDAGSGDGALDLLGLALDDESPLVRARATAALSRRGASALRHLVPRLDVEPDREVLYGTMHAIAAIGTLEAVAALVRCAKGESTHPQHRTSAFRLQASAALVVIRTPQAMAAVGLLREDRDREVREGSQRLVAQAARRTTSMRAVTE